jgi:hypothetical protein
MEDTTETLIHQATEVLEMIEDMVEYYCDQNMVSGEKIYRSKRAEYNTLSLFCQGGDRPFVNQIPPPKLKPKPFKFQFVF